MIAAPPPLPNAFDRMPRMPVLILLCLLWAGLAGAQVPSTALPYEARVPVADQSAPARDAALREALRTVVLRISGAGADSAAADLIDSAQQLVQRYGYEREPDGSLALVAAFDGRGLERRLKERGLAVWGVYAADAEDVQLRISGIDSAQAYARVVSTLRGLPGVVGFTPVRAEGDRLELRVRTEGGAGRLSGALLAAGGLVPDSTGTGELSYRLARPLQP